MSVSLLNQSIRISEGRGSITRGICYYCREPGCCCRGHDDCPTSEHYEKVGKKYATTTVIAARIKSPITTSKNGVRRMICLPKL